MIIQANVRSNNMPWRDLLLLQPNNGVTVRRLGPRLNLGSSTGFSCYDLSFIYYDANTQYLYVSSALDL